VNAVSSERLELHLPIDEAKVKPAAVLAAASGLSKGRIKSAMNGGAVWLSRAGHTRRLRRVDTPLQVGDELHLYYDERVLSQVVAPATLVADEGAFSVWYKPCAMLSQGSKWGDHTTINRWVERHLQPQRPAFITHRLDRAATGLMVLAHSRNTAAELARLFRERAVEKRYRAVVHGEFPEQLVMQQPLDERNARSSGRRLEYRPEVDLSLVEMTIETGRKHQIRRHLSAAGFPIVGDRLYGRGMGEKEPDLRLVSCYLSFVSPEDGEKKIYRLSNDLLDWGTI
jgi:tRNA pseudouridine32 synthase/23S rRNA pseudouridine746 synthase